MKGRVDRSCPRRAALDVWKVFLLLHAFSIELQA